MAVPPGDCFPGLRNCWSTRISSKPAAQDTQAGDFSFRMKFGAHMSTSGGAWRALQRGRSIGCEIVQIFVKNNMQWFGRPPTPSELVLYANELAANRFSCVFGHTGYLINLG